MTVKELKEKIKQVPDDYIVLINTNHNSHFPYARVTYVAKRVNELDGCVLIDNYVEDGQD